MDGHGPELRWVLLRQLSFKTVSRMVEIQYLLEALRSLISPEGLKEEKAAERNQSYYEKYPEDIQRVKDIVRFLEKEDVKLPSGGNLTTLRLRQLGMVFGAHGYIDYVHDIILRFTSDLYQFGFLTRPSLAAFDETFPFDNMVLYALLHEPCYLQGAASNWSAHRMIENFPQFQNTSADDKDPIFFTGEMIFRDMFSDYDELIPLRETADILAQHSDWPDLYDEAQLAKNEVPVYAATYVDDMYVHFDYARETASRIKNCKQFVTNAMYHSALGHKSEELMKQLFALRDDIID
ncbi:hypothetical protein MMC24_001308 [Lignoscripta atroalba]|nr:hypothetical protein [Lignoscripta atroalba]